MGICVGGPGECGDEPAPAPAPAPEPNLSTGLPDELGISCAQITTNAAQWSYITESGPQPWTSSVGCANWQDIQWAASFRNVPFCVESDSRTGGRRIQVHEFPSMETWVNEDLGRLRQQIDVNGFVFGDKSDEWAEILFAACTTKADSAELYLPMRVPLLCVCQSVKSAYAAEQMGRINFRLTFSVDPLGYTTILWCRPSPTRPRHQLQSEIDAAADS